MTDYSLWLLQEDAQDAQEEQLQWPNTLKRVSWRGARALRRRRKQKQKASAWYEATKQGKRAPEQAQDPAALSEALDRIDKPARNAAVWTAQSQKDARQVAGLGEDGRTKQGKDSPAAGAKHARPEERYPSAREQAEQVARTAREEILEQDGRPQEKWWSRLSAGRSETRESSAVQAELRAAQVLSALRAADRAALFFRQETGRRTVSASPVQQAAGKHEADILALDRAVERDARRYDNGFSLF